MGTRCPALVLPAVTRAPFDAVVRGLWWLAATLLSHGFRATLPLRVVAPREAPDRSDLFDLTVFQLDRRRPTEDRDFDLHPRALLVDFLHDAVEARERTIGNAHLLA